MRILHCHVWSVLLYGSEAWTISKKMQERSQAAEMWLLRRMLRIYWTEKKSNVAVMSTAGVGRKLMERIRKRQLEFFGYVMRSNGLEKLVITGKIEGKRARGQQRRKYLNSLSTCWSKNITPLELIKTAKD